MILIMTDDQGYGDIGARGNPVIKTPHLDKFARESVEIDPFYVAPVCSPTRASLLTGRWNYRTPVVETSQGGALMRTEEVTIAELLREAGYKTGIFGKWHLGDCYPMRPQDQGFEETLVHRGGILGGPADPPGNKYQNPTLQRSGQSVQTEGYCSDVFTTAAIDFISKHRQQPFFVYLPYNCPHSPFQIDAKYSEPYEKLKMKPQDFPSGGHPLTEIAPHTAAAYGMITNIDENLGRLFQKIDELDLREDTIVIFMTDNGPNGARWNAGLRRYKGSLYEGGIRTMFYMRWPAKLKARKVDQIAAHIDVLPTLLEACGAPLPEKLQIDGRSFLSLAKGEAADWPDRNLYLQWHRGSRPTPYQGFAVRSHGYKLLSPRSEQRGATYWTPGPLAGPPSFELYDMKNDPLETRNIAADFPEIVAAMRKDYDQWRKGIESDHHFVRPRILLGTSHENPTLLSVQDFSAGWRIGVVEPGRFDFSFEVNPAKLARTAQLDIQGQKLTQEIPAEARQCTFAGVELKPEANDQLRAWIEQGQNRVNITRVQALRRD